MDIQQIEFAQQMQQVSFLEAQTEAILRQNIPFKQGPESTVITGVRRCGKSWLMREIARQCKANAAIFYLDLDDPRLYGFENADFGRAYENWLQSQPTTPDRVAMFFDEPQNVPGWERWITNFSTIKNHTVVLTGSNSNLLSSELATALTGRHKVIKLYPLSFAEIIAGNAAAKESFAERASLFERYFRLGGFPRVWISEDESLLRQYFTDIILKDISARAGSATAQINMELGLSLMTNGTRLINKTKLAMQLGFKQQRTITGHIAAFVNTYLMTEVRQYSPALKKQQRSLPKFYPIDHVLARQTRFAVLDDRGLSLEIMVAIELQRRGYELFYWRSVEGWEVDFLARKMGAELLAVQVCYDLNSDATLERETRALWAARRELGVERLELITWVDRRQIESATGEVKSKSPKSLNNIVARSFMQWALDPE